MLYVPNFTRCLVDSPGRVGLLAKKEVSHIKVFFSVNIFIIKQSILLTFLRLLRIISSSHWKHKKRPQNLSTNFVENYYEPLAYFGENFGGSPNELFHTQYCGIWLIDTPLIEWRIASID